MEQTECSKFKRYIEPEARWSLSLFSKSTAEQPTFPVHCIFFNRASLIVMFFGGDQKATGKANSWSESCKMNLFLSDLSPIIGNACH